MKDKIIKLEEELRLAMLNSDTNKLDELISESLIFIAPSGDIITKEMDMTGHRTQIQKTQKLEPSEQEIQINGDTAIVSVKMSISGSYSNVDISGDYRYLRIWKTTEKGLQVIAGSVCRIR